MLTTERDWTRGARRAGAAVLVAGCLTFIGCGKADSQATAPPSAPPTGEPGGIRATSPPITAQEPGPTSERHYARINEGRVQVVPPNTTVQFIGTHLGEKPDPRTGGFDAFTGVLGVDEAAKRLSSLEVEIQTDSLWTSIEGLTNHLKSPDFFDVRKHPTATFRSTSVQEDGAGKFVIHGELTLLGVAKEIDLPVIADFIEGGVMVQGKLTLDRTAWGMTFGADKVNPQVELSFTIGEGTRPRAGLMATGAGAGPGGPGGGRGRGNFDPEALFKERDKDQDGKLAGDEISERMRENLQAIDTDGDGAISKAEFDERMKQRAAGGPGGAGAAGGPAAGPTAPAAPPTPAGGQ